MPMKAQVEPFTITIPEMEPLLPGHYEELALDKDKVPLDLDWDTYKALDRLGRLLLVTLRDEGRLVGYFWGLVQPHLHYRTCLTCTMDIYYVHPDVRGRFGGVRLMREVERELRRRGVQRWFCGSKLHKDSGRLFKALGFREIESYFSKWIGD